MIVRAPLAGTVSWQGEQLWLAVAGQCALLPLAVPSTWTWRRDLELDVVDAGEPLVLEGDDPTERAECLASERAALARVEALVVTRPRSALASALMAPTRARLERVRDRLSRRTEDPRTEPQSG